MRPKYYVFSTLLGVWNSAQNFTEKHNFTDNHDLPQKVKISFIIVG